MSKILVVTGATGQQGSSVITQILSSPTLSKEYRIRAISRNTSSPAAQSLASRGIEVVAADVSSPATLAAAFKDAEVIFATTVTIYDGHTKQHEIEHGQVLADAAVSAGVPRIIYSTLPHGGDISGGKYKELGHFDGKAEVEAYIRTLKIKSAFVSPGCFMSNFHDNMAPRPSQAGDGTYAWAGPMSEETQLPLFDTAGDYGKWVAAILGDWDKYEGKVLSCATKLYTVREVTDVLSKSSGKTVRYHQVPADVFKGFLPGTMGGHVTEMLLYFQDYGYWGEGTEEKVKWSADQAVGKLTTFEEYLQREPLKLA
ncbi:NmrA-like protein 6 [Elsinoe fawcettii]|nr:NmrA-like protein 6 [Elsinoe fawcettii]